MTLKERIAVRLANCGEAIADMVVARLTQEEMEKRSNAIVTAMGKLNEAEKQIPKPDLKSFDEEGNILTSTYSQKCIENLNSSKKKVKMWSDLIECALSKDEFTKLYKAIENQGRPESSEAPK